jgi:hypothetical protein
MGQTTSKINNLFLIRGNKFLPLLTKKTLEQRNGFINKIRSDEYNSFINKKTLDEYNSVINKRNKS